MPHLLELFSGTGSIGRAFRELGWQVTSVDIDPRFVPDICRDVMELDAGEVQAVYGNVDLLWASPPCTQYSCARTTARTPRDLVGSDALVAHVLDLADALFCNFLIENPHSGLLKTRPVVQGIPMRVLDYCRYGTPYRKRTSIWTNTGYVPRRPLCRKDCDSSDGRVHLRRAQRTGAGYRNTLEELYHIPPALCDGIAHWADVFVRAPRVACTCTACLPTP
jgi:hypothetical protein